MSNKKILLIDDNRDILEAVQLLLEDAGYSVLAVDNGEYIENLDKKNLPDLIILDLLLSGNDGRKLIQLLKSQNFTKNIPVILNSAHPQAKSMSQASGADDFIAKPFDIDLLLSIIDKHLNK